MCKKLIYLVSFILVLGSVSNAEDIQWTDLGADHLWSTPENWDLGRVPTLADEVRIDVPAAAAPNGPVIQDGTDAKAKGILTEAPGEPTLTMTGGTLEVAEWIWYGDGADSFGIWDMSGGTVTVANEFELGWDGGAGTLTMTGGTINAGEAVIPTGSGAFGALFLNGGTYNVTKPGGLSVKENGLIDITEGTLVLEGDETAKVNDLIAAGLITAYGGTGKFELDFDGRNPGKTMLTAAPEPPGLMGHWKLDDGEGAVAVDSSGRGNDGIISNLNGGLGPDGSVWANDPVRGTVISFNGTADGAFVRAGDIPQMTLTNDFTWAFWAKHNAENTADNDIILGNRMDENAVDFVPRQFIKFTPTKFEWHMNGNGDDNLDYDDIPADVWLHHAVVKTGDQLIYYRNGIEASSGTFTQPLDFPQPLFFGGDNEASAGENWSGLMSDVRIYNRALTGLEILVIGIEKVILFAEDFEGLALGPNVDEALAGDAVWTDTPPDGWSIDSDIPGLGNPATDGVAEWAGWAFTDKEWWIAAAEDQDRSLFELGSGTVAVADPDEWDDADRLPIPISADPYDTWLSTPAIGISGCETGTLQLKFDSSWRPEFDDNYHQTANITASFDGGEPVEMMLWESDEASENYKPYATNETVIVNLDNPEGAKSVVLTFGLFDAGNDWWWAIDNVEVSGVLLELVPVDPGTEGLAAYYPLDNDVLDASGNGNDGTIIGDPTFVEGVAGMAMEFNGDDYVNCGNGPSLQIQDAITMAFWFQVEAFQNTWEAFMAKGDDSYRTSRGGGTGDATHMGVSGTTIGSFNGTVIVTGGQWHHMTAVYDGSEARIYIDGVLDTTNPGTGQINISNYDFWIGNNSQQTGRFFHGLLDEVKIYDRVLSEAEILYLAGKRATPVDPGTAGLVAYYAFENDATDSSGNELHGTLVGDAKFAEGPAGYGMALDLDGDGDYVDCGAPPQLGITEQITFTYWIKVVALDKGWNTVLSRGDDSWRSSRAGTDNFMEAAVGGTSGNYLFGVTPVDDDNWHHVGAVYDGATFYLYVDGELDSSEESTGNITVSSYPLYIGNNSQNTDREWTGLIDEVVIYDRALSVGEIRYLAGKRAVDPSLVIYYSFDEVSDIVADQSGKGHDGVVVGDVTAEPEGMYNGAANFASGSYLDLDGPSFSAEDIPTSAMTLAAWIKCANTGGDHEIFSARASDNSWLIHPEPKSSGDIRWLLRSYGGTTIFQIRAGTMTWDEWLHFAGTYDKDSGKAALYINGELIEEIVVENPADIAGDWDLGARVGYTIDNARPFTGLMDEFRMYTRALSQDEILTIMQGM